MRTKILTIVFLIGILSGINAQDNLDKNEMVGFACYFAGQPSKTVEKITKKLNNKKYNSIAKLLTSENNGERYMAVISLEQLTELNKYKLNETEKNLITEIKQSKELVSICSGCTYFEKISLKELLTEKKKLFAKNWLNRNFKTE
jgi:DNA gyrase/topoisomerase IV subunit A